MQRSKKDYKPREFTPLQKLGWEYGRTKGALAMLDCQLSILGGSKILDTEIARRIFETMQVNNNILKNLLERDYTLKREELLNTEYVQERRKEND